MNRNPFIPILIVILIILLFSGNPFFVLPEGQQAVITMFGKPVGKPHTKAGLKIKLPFFHKVNIFDKKILDWDGYSEEIPTNDKRFIWMDVTARWRIKDPLRFFQSVNNETIAQSRLDAIIDAAVRDVVAAHKLIEIIRTSNRMIEGIEALQQKIDFIDIGALEKVQVGREGIRSQILEIANEEVPKYGIELIDVRIKRVNYIKEVRKKVYERMKAERKRAAERFRSEGRGKRAEIEGKTEKELKVILSQAYKQSQKIKGQADATATDIYAHAYTQDEAFYSFLKTLETYQNTINNESTILLTTDAEYFRYLKQSNP